MCRIDWGVSWRMSQSYQSRRRLSAIASAIVLQGTVLASLPSRAFAETSMGYFQDDVPEEVLRAEIYTDARSPIDGQQLSAAEYTELMENLRSLDNIPPEDLVSPKLREVVDLLKLRKFLRQFIPFIP